MSSSSASAGHRRSVAPGTVPLPLQLTLRTWKLAVAKLPHGEHAGTARLEPSTAHSAFWCQMQTPAETSLVCEEAHVPKNAIGVSASWRCFEVLGPLDFAQVGILAGLAQPLAAAGISIFVLSSFDTDYLLVRQDRVPAAMEALRAQGIVVQDRSQTGGG